MLHSTQWSTSRLRFCRKHLLLLLMAFGWLFVNSQIAVASHDCRLELSAQTASVQHSHHMLMASEGPVTEKMSGTLCEKHCIPDVMQKDNGHSDVVALPVADSLALRVPEYRPAATSVFLHRPPETGPPATIRFCRFRE